MIAELVTAGVTARMLGTSRERVHELVAEGRLRGVRVETSEGIILTFSRDEVERLREKPRLRLAGWS